MNRDRNTYRKRFFLLLSLLLSSFLLTGAVPVPSECFYVTDDAQVLSEQAEDEIYEAAKALYEKCGAQIVVLTVDSMEGEDVKDFALETARSWGIGSENSDNGVLILLAVSERKIRIEVGYGLEGCLTDRRTGQLLDELAVPSYAEDAFEEGTVNLFYGVLNVVEEEYGLDQTVNRYVSEAAEEETEEGGGSALAALLLFIVFPLFFVWFLIYLFRILIWWILSLSDLVTKAHRGREYRQYRLTGAALKKTIFFLPRFFFSGAGRTEDETNTYSDVDSGGGGSFGGGGSDRDF